MFRNIAAVGNDVLVRGSKQVGSIPAHRADEGGRRLESLVAAGIRGRHRPARRQLARQNPVFSHGCFRYNRGQLRYKNLIGDKLWKDVRF
jgi:hypothetical protein